MVDDRYAEMLVRPVVRLRVEPLPARNNVRNVSSGYFASSAASGSTFLMARIAVGAVNSAFTPCSEITRQNAPASGVPTGLPS